MNLGIVIAVAVAAFIAAEIWFGWLLGSVRAAGYALETVRRAQVFFAICNLGWLLGVILVSVEFATVVVTGSEPSASASVADAGRIVIAATLVVQFVGACFFVAPLMRARRAALDGIHAHD